MPNTKHISVTDRYNGYAKIQQALSKQLEQGQVSTKELIVMQELLYRMSVIMTASWYLGAAPRSSDSDTMIAHYKATIAYLKSLPAERRYGKNIDKAGIQEYSANLEDFFKTIQESFAVLKFEKDDDYKTNISSAVEIYLSLFCMYRDYFTKIDEEMNANE